MTASHVDSASYEVGYGKPPQRTQFQKGRSGNPGGRPRRPPAERLKELALQEAYRGVVVMENGRAEPVPAIQAVLRSQLELAADGNVRAQRAILAMIQDIERTDAVKAQLVALYGSENDDDAEVDHDDDDAHVDEDDDALSIGAQAQNGNQDRVALVIGNSRYVYVNALPNAANDARLMARALRDIGFAVTDGFDLARDSMERQIRDFLRKSESAHVRLFYYAGHGLQVDGRNYLVPVNSRLESASDLSFETIGLDSILESLDAISRTNIIILDACRNNPFARTFASRYGAGRSVTVLPGLAGYSSLGAGTLIAFSTAPGAAALDGSGANSPFTDALAKHMRTPGLEVRQMLTRVRADVAAETQGKQIPWDNSALLGDVYLAGVGRVEVGTSAPATPGPPRIDAAQPAAPPSADDIVWGTIKDLSVAAVFDEFVNKFPASPHAREARTRADELKRESLTKDESKKTDVAMLPQAGAAQIGNLANAPANAPIASFTRHNGGWSVAFSFAEPVTGISWRLGEAGGFRETGFLDALDPRTRRRMPNPGIQLDADQKATTIYVRYVDGNGILQGSFPIRFDPAGALEREQRKILEMTAGSWLSFREFNGLLVYYTHLMSYRCAIRQVRIGIDSTIPDRPLAMPPCNERDPMAIPADAQPWIKLPPATGVVSVELTYRDGSVSEVKTFRR